MKKPVLAFVIIPMLIAGCGGGSSSTTSSGSGSDSSSTYTWQIVHLESVNESELGSECVIYEDSKIATGETTADGDPIYEVITAYKADDDYNKEPVAVEHVKVARHMQVYISRDTHQVVGLQPLTPMQHSIQPNKKPYRLQPFDQLLQLPVFNRNGYIPNSERPERWFFWPMGVRNPGAVRRFGEHAVSFIGKRHFDDPYLLREIGVQHR